MQYGSTLYQISGENLFESNSLVFFGISRSSSCFNLLK